MSFRFTHWRIFFVALMLVAFVTGCSRAGGGTKAPMSSEMAAVTDSEQIAAPPSAPETSALAMSSVPATASPASSVATPQSSSASDASVSSAPAADIFAALNGITFAFGADQNTSFTIHSDGSFSGTWVDNAATSLSDYQGTFTGQFTNVAKVDDYTYSMQLGSISGIFSGSVSDTFMVYLPGSSTADLPPLVQSDLTWIWNKYAHLNPPTAPTTMPVYWLYNINGHITYYDISIDYMI